MGFFTTQPDDSGRGQFVASNKWWIFIAFAVPLTIFSLGIVSILKTWQHWRAQKRRNEDATIISTTDEQKAKVGRSATMLRWSYTITRFARNNTNLNGKRGGG